MDTFHDSLLVCEFAIHRADEGLLGAARSEQQCSLMTTPNMLRIVHKQECKSCCMIGTCPIHGQRQQMGKSTPTLGIDIAYILNFRKAPNVNLQ